jgi:hypothetical protein
MPDLTAGSTIRALDTPPSVSVSDATDEGAFSNTVFEPGGTPVGVAFIAPTTGRVEVTWYARGESNSAGVSMAVSVGVRTGATIGAGTSVVVANDVRSLVFDVHRDGKDMSLVVENLTAGSQYNAQIEFKMLSAGNGDIFDRLLSVKPLS